MRVDHYLRFMGFLQRTNNGVGELAFFESDGVTPLGAIDMGDFSESNTYQFRVKNVGNGSVNLSEALSSSGAFTITPDISGVTLTRGASILLTATVAFEDSKLAIFEEDGVTPVDLSDPRWFGYALAGEFYDVTFVLKNIAVAGPSVFIDQVEVTGLGFSIQTPPASMVLAPGETTTFVVRFSGPGGGGGD
jgi:hypothetical protein